MLDTEEGEEEGANVQNAKVIVTIAEEVEF